MTEDMQRAIVERVGGGDYLRTACLVAGTTHQTVLYWRRLYESGAEHAQAYADFFTALKRAEAIAESNALRSLKSGGPGWQSMAWFLERRHPDRWASAKDRQAKELKELAAELDRIKELTEKPEP